MRAPQESHGLALTTPIYQKEAQKIHKLISTLSEKELASWMKLSPKLATQTKNDLLLFGKTSQIQGAAILSYAGDVYKGLMAETMNPSQLNFAQSHVAILSGMYGVLRPLDRIFPYRLEMGISFHLGNISSLYKFWGDKPAKAIASWDSGPIINLASEEYYSTVAPFLTGRQVYHIHFREKTGNKLQLKSAFAKKARGLLCRYAIDHKITNVNALQKFDVEGYAYASDVSDKFNLFFVR